MPRLANAVDVLAVRHVKQGTKTAVLRTGFARTYLCVCCDIYNMPFENTILTYGVWVGG